MKTQSLPCSCLCLVATLLIASFGVQRSDAAILSVDISGTWSVSESVTVRTIENGETNTTHQSATGTVEILQRGRNFTIVSQIEHPLSGRMITVRRPGKIVGRTATFIGRAAIIAFGCQQNTLVGTGIINSSSMDFTTEGVVSCSGGGESLRVEIDGTETFETGRTLVFPPFITAQSARQTVPVGTDVVLTVTADGSAPLTYQWKKNRKPIEGATSSTLELSDVQKSASGLYTVAITNSRGTIMSRPVRVAVR